MVSGGKSDLFSCGNAFYESESESGGNFFLIFGELRLPKKHIQAKT